ncbi:10808_t:CDS:1, partial [Cetraspora pellucida]
SIEYISNINQEKSIQDKTKTKEISRVKEVKETKLLISKKRQQKEDSTEEKTNQDSTS